MRLHFSIGGYDYCVGEGLVSRPHLLGESAQGILLLNLGEVEGLKELLEDSDE